MKRILIVEDESLVSHHIKLVLIEAGYQVSGIADSVEEACLAIDLEIPDMVLLDIHLKGNLNGIALARKLSAKGIAFIYLTANFQGTLLEQAKSTLPFGFVVKPFREDDLLTALEVAFYRHQNSLEFISRQESQLGDQIKAISHTDPAQRLLKVAQAIQTRIPFDYLNMISKTTGPIKMTGFLRTGFEEYQILAEPEFNRINGLDQQKLLALLSEIGPIHTPSIFDQDNLRNLAVSQPISHMICKNYGMESVLLVPFTLEDSSLACFEFYSRREFSYTQQHVLIFNYMRSAFQTLLNVDFGQDLPTSSLKTKFKVPLQKGFQTIIGQSQPMLTVLDHVSTVAPLDTAVLILGESGTGKEMIAQSIHEGSSRKDKPLVVVNCALLPPSLIESELFGHEKGAYTGAFEKRIGKFELASGGTLFLDEIGEMSMEMQIKLLRVLQEKEIERIGGKGSIKIDVRIIAATNRDLEKEMEQGRFRLDLYYRIYIFPIHLPALRQRIDDLPALIDYFIGIYTVKYKKQVSGVSAEVLRQMQRYDWPGNVRELEHFIERSILLTKGTLITHAVLPKQDPDYKETGNPDRDRMKTMDENERDYIIAVLQKCNGRIRGAGGAAEMLDLPPTTLHSKIKKLGIDRSQFVNNTTN